VAGAPAITRDSVLARMVGDGSVSAFDRDLVRELWRWEPSEPAPCPLSGCLVGERFLVAHGREVVSLSVVNGAVDWRFETGDAGRVDMVPACDGDLVYFATDGGVVFAVDLARGEEEWRTKTPRRYGGAYPVVLGERVLFPDEGTTGPPWLRRAELRAFQTYDGRELWHSALDPFSNVGVGDGFAAIVGPDNTVLFSVEGGTARSYLSDTLGYGGRRWNGAAPVFVGSEVLVALNENGGHVSMRDLRTGEARWTCELPAVLDVVHAGDRIYVATTRGLFCLADDPGKEPPPPGFVLGPGAEEDEGERASPKSLEDRRRKR
jgi:outer membrane protein assembly factor BamB